MTKETLFKSIEFVAHAGDILDFKIECDALSDESIATIAKYIASRTSFGMVEGISKNGCRRTGCRLADALEPYAKPDAPFNILIVDCVLTPWSKQKQRICQKYTKPIYWGGQSLHEQNQPHGLTLCLGWCNNEPDLYRNNYGNSPIYRIHMACS